MNSKCRYSGYTLIGLMMILCLLSIGAMATFTYADFVARRIAEDELIDIGREFSQAIQSYYASAPSGVGRYPRGLEDLLEDDRFPQPRRHLRRIYRDPLTGEKSWGTVPSADGGILGVFSLSKEEPLREVLPSSVNFVLQPIQGSSGYEKWVFGYVPEPRLNNK
jgi:type II secretory pathway pseudopilin PulG